MAFEPLEFTDELDPLGPPANPKTATPVDAENLKKLQEGLATYTDSSVRVLKEAPINVEYPEYGAVAGLSTDSSKAFQAAIDALPEGGGRIFAPNSYKLTEELKLREKRGVQIVAQSGLGSGAFAKELVFYNTGSGRLIDARKAPGFVLQDIRMEYVESGFTGTCIDLSEAGQCDFQRFHLLGAGGVHSALGLDLNKAQDFTMRHFQFSGLDKGIRGQKEAGSFSNVIHLDGGSFNGINTIPIENSGVVWNIDNVIFENLVNGKAGAFIENSGLAVSRGISFRGCYFGDGNTEGTWIIWRGSGFTLQGGMCGSGALGVSILGGSETSGVNIHGVNFWSMTDAVRAASGMTGYTIGGNAYNSVSGKKVSLDGGSTDSGAGFLSG